MSLGWYIWKVYDIVAILNPEFYNAYYTARVIVDTGGGSGEEEESNGEG